MWIARDYNGSLRLHLVKPVRKGWVWLTESFFGSPNSITLKEDIAPNLKWVDKPIEVKFEPTK